MTPLLRVEGLCAGYGARDAVSDLCFTLDAGECLSIVGESGCGKSTLLKAVLGMTPGLALHAGDVLLDGTSLPALPPKQRRETVCARMGVVFQNPGSAFNPIRSYRKQFTETLKSLGKYAAADFGEQAASALARLGLNDAKRVLDACPYEMSGGMNQRIAIALSLLLGQDVLLADEPTSALDAVSALQVAEELRRLREEAGVAILLVTHNLALSRRLGGRVGVMYGGRLVELGDAEALLTEPMHPYTKSLLAAIPGLDGALPVGLEGRPPAGPSERGCEFAARCPCAGEMCADVQYALREAAPGRFVSCPRGTEGGAA